MLKLYILFNVNCKYVRRAYATVNNFPCLITLLKVTSPNEHFWSVVYTYTRYLPKFTMPLNVFSTVLTTIPFGWDQKCNCVKFKILFLLNQKRIWKWCCRKLIDPYFHCLIRNIKSNHHKLTVNAWNWRRKYFLNPKAKEFVSCLTKIYDVLLKQDLNKKILVLTFIVYNYKSISNIYIFVICIKRKILCITIFIKRDKKITNE